MEQLGKSDRTDKNYDKKQTIIDNLANGTTIISACKNADITPDTFYRWYKEDKEFREGIENAKKGRTCIVEDALYAVAMKGNITAIIYYLCNRCPDAWKNLNDTKHVLSLETQELLDKARKLINK